MGKVPEVPLSRPEYATGCPVQSVRRIGQGRGQPAMDLEWSAEQLELRAEAVTFARAKLNHDVTGDDRAGRFPTEKWNDLAGWGFFGLAAPEDLGEPASIE